MTSVTITLSADTMDKLDELARRWDVEPEELVRATVDELVSSSHDTFRDALDYILHKNEELYKRLAA